VGSVQHAESADTAVFIPTPDVRRGGIALEDHSIVMAVGGWVDRPYHPLPWEPIYLAQEPMLRGDWAAAVEILEREAGEHIGTAVVQFRLACCHARLGEHDLALRQLRRAIDVNPDIRERAEMEEHLAPLRDLDGWAAAVA